MSQFSHPSLGFTENVFNRKVNRVRLGGGEGEVYY